MTLRRTRAVRSALLCLLGLVAVPGVAQAYTTTVKVHGAGRVSDLELSPPLMNCSTGANKSEASITSCVGGAANGDYGWGWTVKLRASVPQAYYDQGWRFSKWVDGSGEKQVNCDPQDRTGDHTAIDCQFAIFDNLYVDLYFVDVAAPDTWLAGGPTGVTSSSGAAFSFVSGDPDAGYQCRLDRPGQIGAYTTCGSPSDTGETFSGLTANGQYTLHVRAVDPSGNVDGSPASRTWTVDTVAPTTTLSGGPAAGQTTESQSASFTFSSPDGGMRFECRLDGPGGLGSYGSCSSPKTYPGPLADGRYTFLARAIDQAANTGAAASRTWTVAHPPDTTITSGPANGSASTGEAAFEFNATEPSTFSCSLDGAPAACTSPVVYADLAEGEHRFEVRATDLNGHPDASPATRTWTVDRTAPDTTLLAGPAEGSTSPQSTTTFAFASPDSTARFECRIDAATYSPCESPFATAALVNGDHVFEVRAVDAAGNADAAPARRAWRVNSLDDDADGYNRPQDCRDGDPAVNPGAVDVPDNGLDENCDGADAANLDRDGDGANRPLDCDDGAPMRHPGAKETPANGVDEDCDGADADHPVVSAGIRHAWLVRGASTRPTTLKLTGVRKGSTVRIACAGKGCPFRSRRLAGTGKTLDIRKLLRGRRLKPGATLTITVSAPGMTAKLLRFTMRRGKPPRGGKYACRRPGARRTFACPTA